jgi:hypothetical protein
MFTNQELIIEYTDGNTNRVKIYSDDLINNLNYIDNEINDMENKIKNRTGLDMSIINTMTKDLENLNKTVLIRDIKTTISQVAPIKQVIPISSPAQQQPQQQPLVQKIESPDTTTINNFILSSNFNNKYMAQFNNKYITRFNNKIISENYTWLSRIATFQPEYIKNTLPKEINSISNTDKLDELLKKSNNQISSNDVIKYKDGKLYIDNSTYEPRPEDKEFINLFNSSINTLKDNTITTKLKQKYFDMLGLGGVIVKYFDERNSEGAQEIFVSGTTGVFVRQQTDNTICKEAIKNEDSRFYGPFKRVFGPKNDEDLNIHFYNFLINGYGLLEDIANGKNFRLYAFGFSGSGKTYTFITGHKSDPPVLVHLIANIKNKTLQHNGVNFTFEGNADGNGNNDGLSYQAFYPLEHNHLKTIQQFNKVSPEKGINLPGGTTLQEMTDNLQKQLEIVDEDLRNKLYVVPTTNNPNSSRAFTLYKIKFHYGNEQRYIIFTDMPGNEKTTLIKTDFLFSDDILSKQKALLDSRLNTIIAGATLDVNYDKIQKIPDNRELDLILKNLKNTKGAITIYGNRKYTVNAPSYGNPKTDVAISFNEDSFENGTLNKCIKVILGYVFKNIYVNRANLIKLPNFTKNIININIDDEKKDKESAFTLWGGWVVDTLLEFIIFFNMKSKLEPGVKYILPKMDEFSNYNDKSKDENFEFIRDFSNALQTKLLKTFELSDEEFNTTKDIKYSENIINNIINKVFDPEDEIYKTDEEYQTKRGKLFREYIIEKENTIGKLLSSIDPNTIRETLNNQFTLKDQDQDKNLKHIRNIRNIRNFGSPIIYTLLALSTKIFTNNGQDIELVKIKDNNYNFVLSLLCFRVILYIIKQGNAINSALENHKFYFLKLAGTFGENYNETELFNGNVKDDPKNEKFIIDPTSENIAQWNSDVKLEGLVKLRPLNKGLRFVNDTFKLKVYTNAKDPSNNLIYFEEIIDRVYMPIFNQILYTGAIDSTTKFSTNNDKAEKALTLVAIKRKLGKDKQTQQVARCKFAIESLQFAEQISNELPLDKIPTEETYSTLGYNKKYYIKYLKYKNKYINLKKNIII